MIQSTIKQLEELKSHISTEHLKEINESNDKKLVSIWKIYISKSKRFKKNTKENLKYQSIAMYAMYCHKQKLINK